MDKQNEAVINTAGEVETPVSTPPVDEPKTTSVDSETPADSRSDEAVVETRTDVPDELPQDQSEQAKAFQTMRRKLKELEVQVSEKKRRQSVFEELKPSSVSQNVPTASAPIDVNQFIDPSTGQFNAHEYNAAVNRAIESARREAHYTASQTVNQTIDENRAREKFPQLDPNSDQFDASFEEKVASRYFFDLYRGKNPTLSKIAEAEAKVHFRTDERKLEKEVAQKVKEQLTEKEQAALSAGGRSKPQDLTSQQMESIRRKSREGDLWATAELMKRAGN